MPSQLHHSGLFQLMARLFSLYFLCSFISLSCGQLATETAYCGSYSLQSDRTLLSTAFHWVGPCGWVCVNVWGGVHHRRWKCSKISLQCYCHLHNWASLSLTRPDSFFFLSCFPAVSASLPSLWQQVYLQHLARLMNKTTSAKGFILHRHTTGNKCRGSRSSYSYSVVSRNCISPQRQRERSYEEAAHCWNQPHPLSMLQTKGGIRKAGLPMQITSSHDCGALNANSVIWANVCRVHQSSLGSRVHHIVFPHLNTMRERVY